MKNTLVFGTSLKPQRYSNIAVHRLVNGGNSTLAFGLRSGAVAGVEIETEPSNFEDVHTITLYLGPERQVQYYQIILNLNPKRVIFNPGTENSEFYSLLQEKGVEVQVACTLVLLATNQYWS